MLRIGGFAVVYRTRSPRGQLYALKRMAVNNENDLYLARQEIAITVSGWGIGSKLMCRGFPRKLSRVMPVLRYHIKRISAFLGGQSRVVLQQDIMHLSLYTTSGS